MLGGSSDFLRNMLGLGDFDTKVVGRMTDHEEEMAMRMDELEKIEKKAEEERLSLRKIFWGTVEMRLKIFDNPMLYDLKKKTITERVPKKEV